MSSNITEQTSPQQTHDFQIRGKITYDRNIVILRHSNNDGSSIYKGKFEGRTDCAVRKRHISDSGRSLIDHKNLESLPKTLNREVKNNLEILNLTQTNIVRYYCYEYETVDNELYLLLALELCDCNLGDFIDPETRKEFPEISDIEIMTQLATGLQVLHSLNIVHRNLKPSNILIKREDEKLFFKLSDLRSAKQQSPTRGDESPSTEYATKDWIAPEIFGQNIVYDKKSDIFTLGLIFQVIATKGRYAFESQDKIKGGESDISYIKNNIPLRCLLERMLDTSPKERPLTEEIISHPALWKSEYTLEFIVRTSDILLNAKKKRKRIIVVIEQGATDVVGKKWEEKLTKEVKDLLFPDQHNSNQPKYNQSLACLLRAIRNNVSHFFQLGDKVKAEFGSFPDGYLSYWTTKFPQLLMYTYNTMKANKDEESLKEFYA